MSQEASKRTGSVSELTGRSGLVFVDVSFGGLGCEARGVGGSSGARGAEPADMRDASGLAVASERMLFNRSSSGALNCRWLDPPRGRCWERLPRDLFPPL